MSFLDFQVRSEVLLQVLRTRSVLTPRLVQGEYQVGSGPIVVVVDSIEILDGSTIEQGPSGGSMLLNEGTSAETSVPCKLWRVNQPVRISLLNLETEQQHLELSVNVPLQLGARRSAGGAPLISVGVMSAEVDLNVFESMNAQLGFDLQEALAGLGAEDQIPIGPLESLVPNEPNFTNVGLAVNNDLDVVAVRAEFTLPGAGGAEWANFCQGSFTKRFGGAAHDWSVFYPSEIMEELLRRGVGEPQDAVPNFNTTLESEITTSWKSTPPTAAVDFTLEIQNFCITGVPPFLFPVDAEAETEVTVEFSVSGSNLLCDVRQDVSLDPMVQFHCGLVMAFFWPIIALMMHEQLNDADDFGTLYTVGNLLPPFVLSNVIVGFLGGSGELAAELEGSCQKIADDHLRCAYGFSFSGDDVLPSLSLGDVVGFSSGMALVGAAGPFPTIARGLKSLEHDPFAWSHPDLCHSSRQEAKARITLTAEPSVVPLLAHVTVRNDSLHVFSVTPHLAGRSLVIDVAYREDANYEPQAYKCEVLILTSEGARIVRLPPVPVKDDNLVLWSIMRVRHCFRAVHQLWGRVYNPAWDVDPPPNDLPFQHLWQIDVAGVPPDKSLCIGRGAQPPDAWARSGSVGMAQLGAMMDPRGSISDLQIAFADLTSDWYGTAPAQSGIAGRSAPSFSAVGEVDALERSTTGALVGDVAAHSTPVRPDPADEHRTDPAVHDRQINLRQQGLSRVGQIRLEVPAVGIALSQAENRSVLLVATETRVSAFDLRVPSSPVLVDEWRLRGVRGMRMIGREAWVWGEFGILTLAVRQSPRAVGELKGVIAVDRRQDVTYVLSGDTVLLCGDDLTRIGSINFRRAVSVAALRGGFAVAGDETVVLFRLEGRRVARPVHELRRADVSDLVRLPIAVAQRALFIRARGGGGSVFDVSEMYRPFEVARYVADPWFFGLHRLGDYTIKVARGAHVDIYVEAGRAVRRLGWTGPDPADG